MSRCTMMLRASSNNANKGILDTAALQHAMAISAQPSGDATASITTSGLGCTLEVGVGEGSM